LTSVDLPAACFILQVREHGGIPPLVGLLEALDLKVQRAAAGALRTLAFKNEENKNQVCTCHSTDTSQVCRVSFLTRQA
jgi:hypothetical protein